MVVTVSSGLETGRELIERSQQQPMLMSRPFLPVGLKLRAAILGIRIKVVQEALNLLEVVQYHHPQPALIQRYLVLAWLVSQ